MMKRMVDGRLWTAAVLAALVGCCRPHGLAPVSPHAESRSNPAPTNRIPEPWPQIEPAVAVHMKMRVLAYGSTAALVRAAHRVLLVRARDGVAAVVPVRPDTRWLGIGDHDIVLAADARGRLQATSFAEGRAGPIRRVGQVRGARVWDAAAQWVAAATRTTVYLSKDGGTSFHQVLRTSSGGPISRVLVAPSGIVVAIPARGGPYVSFDHGGAWRRYDWPSCLRRVAGRIVAGEAGTRGAVLSPSTRQWAAVEGASSSRWLVERCGAGPGRPGADSAALDEADPWSWAYAANMTVLARGSASDVKRPSLALSSLPRLSAHPTRPICQPDPVAPSVPWGWCWPPDEDERGPRRSFHQGSGRPSRSYFLADGVCTPDQADHIGRCLPGASFSRTPHILYLVDGTAHTRSVPSACAWPTEVLPAGSMSLLLCRGSGGGTRVFTLERGSVWHDEGRVASPALPAHELDAVGTAADGTVVVLPKSAKRPPLIRIMNASGPRWKSPAIVGPMPRGTIYGVGTGGRLLIYRPDLDLVLVYRGALLECQFRVSSPSGGRVVALTASEHMGHLLVGIRSSDGHAYGVSSCQERLGRSASPF